MIVNRLVHLLILLYSGLTSGEVKKPNVLIILADDVGTGDIPGYFKDSCKVTKMENIEELASKGIVFTDVHATPLCAPSRYSFLSGNYQIRGAGARGKTSQTFWSIKDRAQFRKGQKSMANAFSKSGYNTGMFGKWHVGGKVPPHGLKSDDNILTHPDHDWTQAFEGGPQDIGFKSSFITAAGIQDPPFAWFRNGILQTKKSDVKYWKEGHYSMPKGTSKIMVPGEGDPNWDSTAYNMIVVNETIQFIDDHLETTPSDPFFAYVATGSVHVPHSPPDEYIDGTPVDKTQLNAHMDMLFELDLVVGSLVDALKDRDLIEDTIIVFASDNGGLCNSIGSTEYNHYSNGNLKGCKGSLYEGGHRVPLIIRYEKYLPAGQTRDHLIGITDLFSTLCEMAGINVPKGQAQDSISFASYAYNEAIDQDLRKFYGLWRSFGMTSGCAIRSEDYKLIHIFKEGKWVSELYNVKIDPTETKDLSQHPLLFRTRKKLLGQILSLGYCCTKRNCAKAKMTKRE